MIDRLASRLLRCHVLRRPRHDALVREGAIVDSTGQAEIRELDPLDAVLQEDVSGRLAFVEVRDELLTPSVGDSLVEKPTQSLSVARLRFVLHRSGLHGAIWRPVVFESLDQMPKASHDPALVVIHRADRRPECLGNLGRRPPLDAGHLEGLPGGLG